MTAFHYIEGMDNAAGYRIWFNFPRSVIEKGMDELNSQVVQGQECSQDAQAARYVICHFPAPPGTGTEDICTSKMISVNARGLCFVPCPGVGIRLLFGCDSQSSRSKAREICQSIRQRRNRVSVRTSATDRRGHSLVCDQHRSKSGTRSYTCDRIDDHARGTRHVGPNFLGRACVRDRVHVEYDIAHIESVGVLHCRDCCGLHLTNPSAADRQVLPIGVAAAARARCIHVVSERQVAEATPRVLVGFSAVQSVLGQRFTGLSATSLPSQFEGLKPRVFDVRFESLPIVLADSDSSEGVRRGMTRLLLSDLGQSQCKDRSPALMIPRRCTRSAQSTAGEDSEQITAES